MEQRTLAVALTALLALSAVPAGAVSGVTGMEGQGDGDGNATVNVTTGQQLSTVLAVTSDDVESEIEATGFRARVETDDESERAESIADRAEELHDRAEAIHEDYEDATEAYREGEIDKSEYARHLATLNARAENLVEAYSDLRARAENVSDLELEAAGLNRTALADSVERVERVRGAGANALLQRFTGEREGEVELDTEGGLSIAVESEDGERSREIERPDDGSSAVTVAQSDALETARGDLADLDASWLLTGASVDRDDGVYAFEFRLDGTATTGEAEVTVDGSSGDVLSLEEEVEPVDGQDDDERDDEADEADEADDEADNETDDEHEDESDETSELALLLAAGEPAPDETVTVQALADGEPASNATVWLNDQQIGTTDGDGTRRVHLPATGEVELVAAAGGEEGELEFDLGERETARDLAAEVSLSDGTVTVSLSYDGSEVGDAVISANGDRVGTTGEDGTVSFGIDDSTEELEVTVVKGEFETEFEYVVENGSLTPEDQAESEAEEDDPESDEESDGETETEDGAETETADGSDDEESETEDDEDAEETPEPTETEGDDD